jgi:ATP-dependent DNA helicase RecQ
MQTPIQVLKQYWGFEQFRPLQEEIINAVLEREDTVGLLPTGGGKSICFQVPALIKPGICIVISPLIALMKDQVAHLRKKGIKADGIYSGMNQREIDIILDNCIYGHNKFLYVSPERLKTEIFKVRAARMKIDLIAIDEAHCISQWGYDFRPAYLEIEAFLKTVPEASRIALTATATSIVLRDITEKLGFENPHIFQRSFSRPNLSYSVFETENKYGKLSEILDGVPGSSVVYVRSRKKASELSSFLNKRGISASFYHGGLDNHVRHARQEKWINNQTRVMVSTNAFGMGIDKPDVRTVIHFDIPPDLESYYQEAGRAGRDGEMAYAVLLYHQSDIEQSEKQIAQANPTLESIKKVYQLLANYLKIATGSAALVSFDFDLRQFTQTFGLNLIQTFHQLKRLEDFGLISLNDSFYEPSKVKINGSTEDVYRFEIEHAAFESLLKGLLRMYGGEIFQRFIKVNEEDLAKLTRHSADHIRQQLAHLHSTGLLEYIPRATMPQLTFLTPRLSTDDLPIQSEALTTQMARNRSKFEKVKQYLTSNGQCRTQWLCKYFGETLEAACGICDWCFRQKSEKPSELNLKAEIMKLVEQGPLQLNQLKRAFPELQERFLMETIRVLADQELISFQNSTIHRKND